MNFSKICTIIAINHAININVNIDSSNLFPRFFSRGDHTEVIQIDYDPSQISYKELLSLFWNNHEYGLTTKIKKQVNRALFL